MSDIFHNDALWHNVEWVRVDVLGRPLGWVPVTLWHAFEAGEATYDDLKAAAQPEPPAGMIKASDF
jgi:hypothetical protein